MQDQKFIIKICAFAKKPLFVGLFLFLLFSFEAQKNIFAATNSDGVNINLDVAFCNADLICDPEENYISCLSDCPAPTSTPPVATSTPTSTPQVSGSTGRNSATSRSGINAFFLTDYFNDIVIGYITDVHSRLFFGKTIITWKYVSNQNSFAGLLYSPTVRILRDTKAFPLEPDREGLIVYEGNANIFYDTNSTQYSQYFYTIFSKNQETGQFDHPIFVKPAYFYPVVYENLDINALAFSTTSSNEQNWFGIKELRTDLAGEVERQRLIPNSLYGKTLEREEHASFAQIVTALSTTYFWWTVLCLSIIALTFLVLRLFLRSPRI